METKIFKIELFDKARAILTLLAAIAGILTAVDVGLVTYNSRYDANAVAAAGFKMRFKPNVNLCASTIRASAGTIKYGLIQNSGKRGTSYKLAYKGTSSSGYKALRTVRFDRNGKAYGDYKLLSSRLTGSYDFRAIRTNNTRTNSVLEVDWAVVR